MHVLLLLVLQLEEASPMAEDILAWDSPCGDRLVQQQGCAPPDGELVDGSSFSDFVSEAVYILTRASSSLWQAGASPMAAAETHLRV